MEQKTLVEDLSVMLENENLAKEIYEALIGNEEMPEEKQKVLKEIFNNLEFSQISSENIWDMVNLLLREKLYSVGMILSFLEKLKISNIELLYLFVSQNHPFSYNHWHNPDVVHSILLFLFAGSPSERPFLELGNEYLRLSTEKKLYLFQRLGEIMNQNHINYILWVAADPRVSEWVRSFLTMAEISTKDLRVDHCMRTFISKENNTK